MRKLVAISASILLSFSSIPAQAATSEIWGPSLDSTLAQQVIHDGDLREGMLPVPNIEPSTDGHSLMVWYGAPSTESNPGGGCGWPWYAPPINCGVAGQIFDSEGVAVTDSFWISEFPADYYGGSPEIAWNPIDEQWLVVWDSEARWVGGYEYLETPIFMQLVNLDGTLAGETVKVSTSVYVPETDTTWSDVLSDSAGNLSVIWDSELERYFVTAADGASVVPYNPEFNTYLQTRNDYFGTGSAGYVIGNLFDADLTPVNGRDEFTLLAVQDRGNSPVQLDLVAESGLASIVYRAGSNRHSARLISLNEDSFEVGDRSELSLGLSGGTEFATVDSAYNADLDRLAFLYHNHTNKETYIAHLDIGSTITVDPASAVRVVDFPDLSSIPGNAMALRSPTLVYSRNTATYHFATGVLFDSRNSQNTVMYWTVPAADLTAVTAHGQYTHDRFSFRPRLGEYSGHVAMTYIDWHEFPNNDSRYDLYMDVLAVGGPFAEPEPEPIDYVGPTLTGFKVPAVIGGQVTLRGTRLDRVDSATIAGVDAQIVSQSAGSITLAVPNGVRPGLAAIEFEFGPGSVRIDNALELSAGASSWTKRLSSNQAKFYAKNIVGEGKVRFVLNGREIAWINAGDASDPKLRSANGAYYLVRTVSLKAGKNVLEIYVDGVREKRVVYTR